MYDDVLISLPNLFSLRQNHVDKIWKTPPGACSHVNKEVNCTSNKKCSCTSKHPVFVDEEHNMRYVRTLQMLYNKSEQLGGIFKRYV